MVSSSIRSSRLTSLVLLDQAGHHVHVPQYELVVLDLLLDVLVLLLELLDLQAGQARQPHVQDRPGLDLAEREALHEPPLRRVRIG
jgi:hypothetical protein